MDNPITNTANVSVEVVDGSWLKRVFNKDELYAVEVFAQHLEFIIDFASSKTNISMDLKQNLIRLC